MILIRKKIIHSHLPSKWNKKRKKNDTPISLIHSDAWGHTPVASLISHCYYVSVIENCTRCTWLYDYPVKSLVKVLSILCVFVRCFCLVLFSSFFGIKFIVIKILKKKASSIFKIFDKMTQIQMVLLRGSTGISSMFQVLFRLRWMFKSVIGLSPSWLVHNFSLKSIPLTCIKRSKSIASSWCTFLSCSA